MVTRDLERDDDLTNLAKDIQAYGLAVPVLVDQNMNLIDGLRRLRAVESLGQDSVDVVVTSMYPVACEMLKRAREHGIEAAPLGPRRIWQIYTDMQPIFKVTKSTALRGRQKGQRLKHEIGGRPLLAKALDLPSEAVLQAITYVYRLAQTDTGAKGTKAREAVRLLESGEVTAYGAADYIKRTEGLKGSITNLNEQRVTLRDSVSSLRGLVTGLERLGPLNKGLRPEEKEQIMRDFAKLRGRLYRFVKQLQEETRK
jgi:hypothetical protein